MICFFHKAAKRCGFGVLLLCFLLCACKEDAPPRAAPVFHGSAVLQEKIGGDFSLTGGGQRPFRLQDLRGKVVVLSFGFTHCPDVCPTELATYADMVKQLGKDAKRVAVVFVSVDPERDTPDLADRYARLFHHDFIGLSAGKGDDLEAVKKAYRISVRKVPLKGGAYTVEHTAGTFLINREGKAEVFEPYGKTAAQIAADVKILLE